MDKYLPDQGGFQLLKQGMVLGEGNFDRQWLPVFLACLQAKHFELSRVPGLFHQPVINLQKSDLSWW